MLNLFFEVVVIVFLLISSYFDIKKRKIPNLIILCLLVIAVFSIIIQNKNLISYLFGMLIPSLILIVLNFLHKNFIGNGDIKLLIVTGLLIGYHANLLVFSMSCILSITFAIVYKTLTKETLSSLPFAPFITLSIIFYKTSTFLID